MGYMTALGLAENLDLEVALQVHLRSNLFPPVPLSMVEPCKEAITAAVEYDLYRIVALPEGVTWRGEDEAPAWAIIEGHRLEAFVETEEDREVMFE